MEIFLENEYGVKIKATGNENRWQVTSLTGLNPPPAVISTSAIPNIDGSRFNTSRLDNRNIVLTMAINGDVEGNLEELNRIISPKRYIKIYYSTSEKDLYAEGRVETFEYDKFEGSKIMVQASILCFDPYWHSQERDEQTLSNHIGLFEFPFSIAAEGIAVSELVETTENRISNLGTVVNGLEFTIEVTSPVVNPYVQNITTGEKMTFNLTLNRGDVLKVNTARKTKYIRLYSNGETTNVLNKLANGSKWITLAIGDNSIVYGSDTGLENMVLSTSGDNLFGGV